MGAAQNLRSYSKPKSYNCFISQIIQEVGSPAGLDVVATIEEFRDTYLTQNAEGIAIIESYYADTTAISDAFLKHPDRVAKAQTAWNYLTKAQDEIKQQNFKAATATLLFLKAFMISGCR
ncbi:MAG: hypothetical protein EOP05_02520 [Proteobacteria bacterium]|nr:MAG: hypothetical protein EOP05_02520 [Pseudomonadota bacterium]